MRKAAVLALIFILPIISFCTSPFQPSSDGAGTFTPSGVGGGGVGVVIKKLGVYPQKVVQGSTATMILILKNAGQIDTNVKVELYGFDENVLKLVSGVEKKTIHLEGADPTLNSEGGEESITWQIQPKVDLPETFEITTDIWVRITYDYETSAIGKVELIDVNEYARLEAEGKLKTGGISLQNSNSPIQISVEGTQPLPIGSALVLKLKVNNVGQGLADDNKAKLTVSIPELGVDCASNVDLFLRKGTSTELTTSCDLPKNIEVPKGTYTLKITLEYTYYQDEKVSVVVEGRT